MALLRNRQVVEDDPWLEVEDEQAVPPEGDVIVGLSRWLDNQQALSERSGRIGVRLEPTDDPLALEDHLQGVELLAVNFPQFADGRGFTHARIVRERLGFEGEVRAVGDVLPDQLYYMQRCGIDAFALRSDKDPAQAIACLDDMPVTYQGATDDPRPLYRRQR